MQRLQAGVDSIAFDNLVPCGNLIGQTIIGKPDGGEAVIDNLTGIVKIHREALGYLHLLLIIGCGNYITGNIGAEGVVETIIVLYRAILVAKVVSAFNQAKERLFVIIPRGSCATHEVEVVTIFYTQAFQHFCIFSTEDNILTRQAPSVAKLLISFAWHADDIRNIGFHRIRIVEVESMELLAMILAQPEVFLLVAFVAEEVDVGVLSLVRNLLHRERQADGRPSTLAFITFEALCELTGIAHLLFRSKGNGYKGTVVVFERDVVCSLAVNDDVLAACCRHLACVRTLGKIVDTVGVSVRSDAAGNGP